jgi:hypothetical protein
MTSNYPTPLPAEWRILKDLMIRLGYYSLIIAIADLAILIVLIVMMVYGVPVLQHPIVP